MAEIYKNPMRPTNDPVLLSDAVYVKGTRSSSVSKRDDIWKYSVSEKCWSSLPTPSVSSLYPSLLGEHAEMSMFILSSYKSHLVFIGGYVYTQSSVKCSDLNRKVFVLNDNKWNSDIISPLPSNITFGSSFKDVSVSSNGSQLVLVWLNDHGQNIELLFYDGKDKQWKKAQGPKSTSSHTRVSVFLDKEAIFVTKQGGAISDVYSASVTAVVNGDADTRTSVWRKSDSIYSGRYSNLSNITVLGNRLVMLDPCSNTILCFERSDPARNLWKKLIELQLRELYIKFYSDVYLSIIGLSDRELLVMGYMNEGAYYTRSSTSKFIMLKGM